MHHAAQHHHNGTPAKSPSPTLSLSTFFHDVWHGVASMPLLLQVMLGVVVIVSAVRGVRQLMYPPVRSTTPRRFSRADRAAIIARAGGKCEHYTRLFGRCRANAEHADHVIPHSRGGATTVENGAALCAKHNRQKGATVPLQRTIRATERRRKTYS